MKKNKIVALIVLGIILLQIVIPSLADIDWNVVFAEETNTWDISQNGDGSVMATLSDDGTLTISGNGEMKDWEKSYVVAWDSNRENIKNVIINNGVTSIGNYTFSDCRSLTNITIPNSVTSIGVDAFYYCTSLTNITIPNSVTSIGGKAFLFCRSLTSITIPDSVTSIGYNAFFNCESLTSINVDSNNEKYMSDNGVLYTKDKKTLIQYPSKKEGTEYLILQGVESIGESAFNECTGLTNITIPDSVTSIGNFAFCECTSLTRIIIPDSVTSIGNFAFSYCTSLTSITISNSVTSIGKYAFKYCSNLTSITIPSSVISIREYAFECCSNLTSITIPNSVTSIENFAFSYCTSLTSITIPNSVTSIGYGAFHCCTSLTSINVDSNNEKYMSDNGVLYTKDKKTLIQYPSKKEGTEYLILQGVESIGDYAFEGCENLINITIPDSVTSIMGAFKGCSSLINITIPNSVTSIGGSAFECCSSLTSITIPDSVTSIGDDAFYKCDSLSVLCKSNSYAEQYAKENNIKYVIDDSVPTIKNVTGNPIQWIKNKVTLTVNAEDSLSGLATEAYSFDNGQTWQKENTKTYTENTQGIIIKVRDAVGNVATYKTIYINNILKIEISNYEKITKDNNEYLTKIEANTTIAQLKEKIKTNGTIKVLKGNNEITDTNTLVGTGMQIQIETEKYIAIVKADLNGDGKIGLSDLSNIKFSLIGKKQLSTEAQIAGDINGDGKVSLSDMAKLKMYLVGKANI